ncbi:LysR family transcriptional regulator [Herbiconiux sp.]|uniref:LysR family transcriptional regulator n=1 Tax=Herbiconiux sp. TaxID=1871186 RepID=UPI0025C34287|nr:LysR family transcriptional regulator [Herbiconiux sp.]
MELRQLANFVAVVEARSFTAAAARLGVSQPALSQSIARLERDVGCALLVRNKRLSSAGVAPTASGESLLADAIDILQRVQGARDRALRADADEGLPVVLLGFSSSTPRELVDLATASAPFDDAFALDVVPIQLTWGEEIHALRSGRVDVAFLHYPAGAVYPGLTMTALLPVRRVVILPGGHRLAGASALTLRDLAGEPILDPGVFDDEPGLRDYWLAAPRPTDAPMGRIVGPPTKTVEEMCAFVRAGRGTAIAASAVAAQYPRDDLAFIPIVDLESTDVGIAVRSEDKRPHVTALYDTVVRETARLEDR